MVVRQAVALTKDLTSDKKGIYYRLKTDTGNYLTVTEGELKNLIKSKKIEVLNLELTSDYELKDKDSEYAEFNENVETYKNTHVRVDRSFIRELNCKKALSFKSNVNIESMKSKASLLGTEIIKIKDYLYLYKLENETSITVLSNRQMIFENNTENMFKDSKFTSIDLRGIDTSLMNSCKNMFRYCEAKEINLSEFDTSNVTTMNSMFSSCKAKDIDVSNFDTSNVINMEDMFRDCNLVGESLKNMDTHKVTTMSGMFNHCKTDKLDLRSFHTSNVTNMEDMFSDCKVDEINVSSFDTSKVCDMSGMFQKCITKKLDLSSFNTSNVTKMINMFRGCRTEELNISSFDTSKVCEMQRMFQKCRTKELDLSHFDTSKVDKIYVREMFDNCYTKIIATDRNLLRALKEREECD